MRKMDDPRCIGPVLIGRDMFEKPWCGLGIYAETNLGR